MHVFIEKNDRFLRLCCCMARFFGLFFLGIVLLAIIMPPFVGGFFNGRDESNFRIIMYVIPALMVLFQALLLLGIEQLIKCLIISDYKPNWILRYADKIIYLFIVFLLVKVTVLMPYTQNAAGYNLLILLTSIAGVTIKIIIWIGIALLLKKIVPIIQESKTLV